MIDGKLIDDSVMKILKECEWDLCSPDTKEDILDECVSERFKMVIDVQNSCLDDALARLERHLDYKLDNIDDVRKLCKILSDVSKAIAKNRLEVYDNILNLIYEKDERHARSIKRQS